MALTAVPRGAIFRLAKRLPSLCAIGMSLILGSFSQLAPKAADIRGRACVLSVRGEWVAGSEPMLLQRGTILASGTEVRSRRKANREDFIVLVDADNRVVQRRCSVDPCNEPLMIVSPKETSAFSEVLEAVSELWRKDEQRYGSLLSRGSELQETVLELSDGSVNLAPLLKSTDKRQRVHLESLQSGETSSPQTFDLEFDAEQADHVLAPKLRPGLYNVRLSSAGPNPSPTDKAWVLLAPSGVFQQINSRFKFAREQAVRWRETADPTAVKSFLRAYLEYLARGLTP